MPIPILVPRLGWSMDEGAFGQWLVREGEVVNEGDALFELESDKATQEVESFETGILRLGPDAPQPGDTVKVGQTLGYLCEQGEEPPSEPTVNESSAANPREATNSSNPVASPSVRRLARELHVDLSEVIPDEPNGRISGDLVHKHAEVQKSVPKAAFSTKKVSPRAARLAAEAGVNLALLEGSGRNGRIRERDVREAMVGTTAQSAVEQTEVTPSSSLTETQTTGATSLRRVIAQRMLAGSQQTAPVTLTTKCDATNLVTFREQFKNASDQVSVPVPGFSDLFIKLSAHALQKHRTLSHLWTDAGVFVPESIDIAVAIDTPAGLFAPVVRDVPDLQLADVSRRVRDYVERAHARQITPEDLQNGVFTISNLGQYRVDAFTPIINLPQTAILGIGRIVREPVVIGDDIDIREQVSLSLTFDHRVVDGAPAADFLTTLCEYVENPIPWLIA